MWFDSLFAGNRVVGALCDLDDAVWFQFRDEMRQTPVEDSVEHALSIRQGDTV